MVTGTVEIVAGTHIVLLDAYCHLNCAVYCVGTLSPVQQTRCGQSLTVCCFELTKHKYRHRCAILSLLSCGKSHLVVSKVLPCHCKCKHTLTCVPTFLSGYVLPVVILKTNWHSVTYRSALTGNHGILPVINNNYWRIE